MNIYRTFRKIVYYQYCVVSVNIYLYYYLKLKEDITTQYHTVGTAYLSVLFVIVKLIYFNLLYYI